MAFVTNDDDDDTTILSEVRIPNVIALFPSHVLVWVVKINCMSAESIRIEALQSCQSNHIMNHNVNYL